LVHATNHQQFASCSSFAPRTINGWHPVLRSRHEPSTVCILFFRPRHEPSTVGILFLVRATNHQRFASRSWFAPRIINGWHPVLRSRHEPSTVRVLFFVRATNHQRFASRLSARSDRGFHKPSPFAEYGKSSKEACLDAPLMVTKSLNEDQKP